MTSRPTVCNPWAIYFKIYRNERKKLQPKPTLRRILALNIQTLSYLFMQIKKVKANTVNTDAGFLIGFIVLTIAIIAFISL